MKMKTDEYIQRRVKALQRKWNFNPEQGIAQIKGHPDPSAVEAFGEFKALRNLIRKCGLAILIPYSPTADRKTKKVDVQRDPMIYVGRLDRTRIFKIGFTSRDPHTRLKEIQNGVPVTLKLVHAISVAPNMGKAIEGRVHLALRKYATNPWGKSRHPKGETFELPDKVLKGVVRELKTTGDVHVR